MIFLFGPRQVGKTTFARNRLKELNNEELYFNWDDPFVRREYIKNPHFLKTYLSKATGELPLVVFDEIHKHKNWKNILKGLYDIHHKEAQFLITGSARLDYFRQSGDSLIGRYFSFRLLPIGLVEAANNFNFVLPDETMLTDPEKNGFLSAVQKIPETIFKPAFEKLAMYGGFPEPFIKGKETFSRKWRKDYKSLLVNEDLRDLSRISDIKGIELLVHLLPERISSPLSINSLREDLQVSHKTIVQWLEALKKIYLIFSLPPWSQNLSRAITKETKVYFYDWPMADKEGPVFENMLALLLYRFTCRLNELGIGDFDLNYIKNRQGHEIDFVLIKNNKPCALFEAKKSETKLTQAGLYFSKLLGIPYYQIISDKDDIEVYPHQRYIIPAWRILSMLG